MAKDYTGQVYVDIRRDWKCLSCGIMNAYHDKWCMRAYCFTTEGTRSRNPKM